MNNLPRSAAVSVALSAPLAGGVSAQTLNLPPTHTSGGVGYLSGGIGRDESTAIEKASPQWPLTLEFAVRDRQRAEFVANVDVTVRDAKGHQALRAKAAEPFVLAKLPPGHYAVGATIGGRVLHEHVVVGNGKPAKLVFVWPAGSDTTS